MNLKTTIAAALALAALAAPAAATAAEGDAPRIVGTPTVTAAIAENTDNGRFVSLAATVRLNRRFANTAEQHRYTVVAAPKLPVGRHLPDELFGGGALGRLSNRKAPWYRAEVQQVRQRRTVAHGARWQLALARDNVVIGTVKTVTIRRR